MNQLAMQARVVRYRKVSGQSVLNAVLFCIAQSWRVMLKFVLNVHIICVFMPEIDLTSFLILNQEKRLVLM